VRRSSRNRRQTEFYTAEDWRKNWQREPAKEEEEEKKTDGNMAEEAPNVNPRIIGVNYTIENSVPKFKGTRLLGETYFGDGPSLSTFLAAVENHFLDNGITSDNDKKARLFSFVSKTEGSARVAIDRLMGDDYKSLTYEEVKTELKTLYQDATRTNFYKAVHNHWQNFTYDTRDKVNSHVKLESTARTVVDSFLSMSNIGVDGTRTVSPTTIRDLLTSYSLHLLAAPLVSERIYNESLEKQSVSLPPRALLTEIYSAMQKSSKLTQAKQTAPTEEEANAVHHIQKQRYYSRQQEEISADDLEKRHKGKFCTYCRKSHHDASGCYLNPASTSYRPTWTLNRPRNKANKTRGRTPRGNNREPQMNDRRDYNKETGEYTGQRRLYRPNDLRKGSGGHWGEGTRHHNQKNSHREVERYARYIKEHINSNEAPTEQWEDNALNWEELVDNLPGREEGYRSRPDHTHVLQETDHEAENVNLVGTTVDTPLIEVVLGKKPVHYWTLGRQYHSLKRTWYRK